MEPGRKEYGARLGTPTGGARVELERVRRIQVSTRGQRLRLAEDHAARD